MAARNCIELSIPLTLTNGRVIRPIRCTLTADSVEGYTEDVIQRNDTVLLDFVISSADGAAQTVRTKYLVTHAHPEFLDERPCTWFMAMAPSGGDSR